MNYLEHENSLLFENQSRFEPSDSCINQLLTITHETFSRFNENYEVRGISLDILEAFDKLW